MFRRLQVRNGSKSIIHNNKLLPFVFTFHFSPFIAIQREKRDMFLSDAITGVVYSVPVHNTCIYLIDI
jgi:hypothetical protein